METDMSPIDDSYDQVPQQPQFYQEEEQPYYQQPSQVYAQSPPQVYTQPSSQKNFFSNIDSTTWIIIGLLVLVAFFMGKTMQPVFIKTS